MYHPTSSSHGRFPSSDTYTSTDTNSSSSINLGQLTPTASTSTLKLNGPFPSPSSASIESSNSSGKLQPGSPASRNRSSSSTSLGTTGTSEYPPSTSKPKSCARSAPRKSASTSRSNQLNLPPPLLIPGYHMAPSLPPVKYEHPRQRRERVASSRTTTSSIGSLAIGNGSTFSETKGQSSSSSGGRKSNPSTSRQANRQRSSSRSSHRSQYAYEVHPPSSAADNFDISEILSSRTPVSADISVISEPFSVHEFSEVLTDTNVKPEGVVNEALADTGKTQAAKHEDISPWLFQGEAPKAPKGRPRSRTENERPELNILPMQPSQASSLRPSPSALSLRADTSPSASGLASPLNGSRETPSSYKKSKNPFTFLKKKSSNMMRDSDLHPSSRQTMTQPVRTATWGGDAPTKPNTLGSPLMSHRHAQTPSALQPAFSPTPGQARHTPRSDGIAGAVSLEDELDGEPKSDSRGVFREKRRLRGLHLGKERGKEDADGTDDGNASGRGAADHGEVELSLDMNFDHIDDIVDTSAARQRMVGPMNEPMCDFGGSPFPRNDSTSSSEAAMYKSPSGSNLSSSMGSGQASPVSSLQTFAPVPRSAAGRSFTGGKPMRMVGASPSGMASNIPDGKSAYVGLQGPVNRRISLAEAQQHTLRRASSNLRDRTVPPANLYVPERARSNSASAQDLEATRSQTPQGGAEESIEARKGSIASATSLRSSQSGISPKTSFINLSSSAQEGKMGQTPGWANFTPTSGIPSAILGMRKSSASSGQGVSSSWMAPDSWAVQPDKSKDYLRDGDEEDEDDDEAQSLPRDRRGSSSGMSGTASAMFRSGSSDPHYRTDSIVGSRRGTEESIETNGLGSGRPGTATNERPMSIEVLDTSNILSSPLIQPPLIARPSSRGGPLAAAGGSVAAAAGKLGLHRSSKQRGSNTRPNTAGSIGSARPSTTNLGLISGLEDDSSISAFAAAKDSSSLKRPGTASSQPFGKNYFIRVFKTDDSFATITCPLMATTQEVRTILARKSLTQDSTAYRLFVRDKGSERPLGNTEKPAWLQRRRLEQAGYNELDSLEEIGRDDLSYLLRFVYRPDSVPTFDSDSFSNDEHTFQHLDLQGRNLEMVPIFLYRHADWIVSLDLSGNPMSDIPSDFIQLCTSLRSLRLSNLALKRIPQSVRQSETLTHLDVSNNRLPELAHITLDSVPELMSIKAQNNRLFDLPPYFANLKTLRHLNISNNRYEEFPIVICELTSLVDLDISFNAISVLPDQISQLVNLERLVLVGNSVEILPSSMSELISLQTIDLRRNLVQDVSPLFSLPKLQIVQCEHNSIKAFEATIGAQLRTLEMGKNPLSRAKIGADVSCDLTTLDLSSTNMAKLEEDLFRQLKALVNLVLDRNQFVVLPDTLGELENLEYLSVSNNLLATLPDSVGKLGKLRKLIVHNNNLKSLPPSLWNCQSLESINVSSNLLESFPPLPLETIVEESSEPGALLSANGARKSSAASVIPATALTVPGTPTSRPVPPLALSLKKLRLGDNRLTDDVFSVLSLLRVLEVLNLSFNEIFEIPNYTLSKHGNLRELYLSGNNLSSIPADDLEQLQSLRIMHLNGNKLQTLPAELGRMSKLANLDVGNNVLKYNIANWHYDWNWNSNPELRYLNLSGNKRLEIKSKLADVGGRRTNISDFNRLYSLRLLGLMDVTMTLQSTPDETENRRVRTSLSQINNMAYGIADALGKHDNLSIVDVVIPRFRKEDNECVFGLFDGRGHGPNVGSRIARHLAEWCDYRISWEIQRLGKKPSESDPIPNVLRRAFLRLEKEYADVLINEGNRKLSEAQAVAANDESKAAAPAIAATSNRNYWKAGASAVLAYIVDKTMYIANSGDALAVLSRNGGTAHLVSTKHEPFDRDETQRIRSAEGWVSLRGYVNDSLDVSRSFGYYHLFPIVNAAPAVATINLTDSDEFVVLANKVLWEHVSYQTAVDIARMERNDPMMAAQKLRDFAISYGAEESVMVMVVSVGDLFYNRQQRNAAAMMTLNPALDAMKKGSRRPRDDLPGDRTLARLEREVAPPIGQVALVFTDIKNSTSLWETNGGMQTAMRLHNYLLRRQLRTIGGYEVKTEGDAFMVSFPSVSSALLWCFTVQQQLLNEEWPQEILESEDGKEVYDPSGELIYRGLSVRMGIHWGFPVCEADPITRRMDYFGPMVNRAARISGAADGGQIMASKDVITELKGLLGTFDESNGNGGEPESSPSMNKVADELDEDAFRLLHPNVSRDVVLLRRMGFGISSIGERRLKGLETPESLSLVYPKQLAGRLQETKLSDAPAPQVYEPTIQLLDIEEVKQVGMLCLRLEALSNRTIFPGVFSSSENPTAVGAEAIHQDLSSPPKTPPSDGGGGRGEGPTFSSLLNLGGGSHNHAFHLHPSSSPASLASRRKGVQAEISLHPELLIFAIRDDATDEELASILDQLTTRINNSLSTISLNLLHDSIVSDHPGKPNLSLDDPSLKRFLGLVG
ncbi:hypothetical protein IE53DRAFT_368439 [Violaceomyces palustris]|uniref:Uncharacterized protein n=1 Tax=Violaceomyces palustris TaxID=1673888 RepID=A0ACD0NYX9_9BASI|nr:hypothetical protein IE53DRAFT_368439 [Violaceomyces palustris]